MNNARCVVLLTFDFDAESLWLSRDPTNWDRPGVLSQGTYGARVGVPRLLELLREEDLPATFFVPGWVAEFHQDKVEAIHAAGHEIGHHGYLHEWVDPSEPAREREAIEKGLAALRSTVGVVPKGYRSPAGEVSHHVAELLKEKGFLYDSSMLDDVFPYRSTLRNGEPGVVQIPWSWTLDDAIYLLFSIKTPRSVFTNDHILKIWTDEFDAIYRWGGVFNLLMHPQIIGRPSRLELLRAFVRHVRKYPDVVFAQAGALAEHFVDNEPPFEKRRFPERPSGVDPL